jgi:uncharacterized protein YkwD
VRSSFEITGLRLLVVIFLLVVGVLWFPASPDAAGKNVFDRYTFRSFRDYGPANEPIDFGHIDYPLLCAAVFFETDHVRAESGLPVLLHSSGLAKAASMHSADMVREGFFSHENPNDRRKRTLVARMTFCGLTFHRCAENIADVFGIRYREGSSVRPPSGSGKRLRDLAGNVIGNHTYISFARMLVGQWMQSPGHRANILDPQVKYLGVGARHYRDKTFYDVDRFIVTQVFSDRER